MARKPNPKLNVIDFGASNPKTVGEKSSLNPNPREPKPADIRPETAPLSSLVVGLLFKFMKPLSTIGDRKKSHLPYIFVTQVSFTKLLEIL
jgi:hypothetical protein